MSIWRLNCRGWILSFDMVGCHFKHAISHEMEIPRNDCWPEAAKGKKESSVFISIIMFITGDNLQFSVQKISEVCGIGYSYSGQVTW